MTKKMPEFKPCPFCPDGGKPKLFERRGRSTHPFVVICVNKINDTPCQAQRWPSFTAEQAVDLWNTRADLVCQRGGEG